MSSNGVVNANGVARTGGLFHLYTVAALVVFAVLVYIAWGNNDNVHAWARLPSWLANSTVLALVTLVTLGLAAFATGVVSKRGANAGRLNVLQHRVTVGSLFVVVGLLYILAAILVYRTYDFWFAFWVLLLALVLVSVHTYLCSLISPGTAALVLPLVGFTSIAVYYVWHMAGDSVDTTDSTYEVNSVSYKEAAP